MPNYCLVGIINTNAIEINRINILYSKQDHNHKFVNIYYTPLS